MIVMGIHAFTHDSAVAVADGGRLIAYGEEERFSRVKGDSRFPAQALAYCLDDSGLRGTDIDRVIIPFRPLRGSAGRIFYTLRHAKRPMSRLRELCGKGQSMLNIKRELGRFAIDAPIRSADHYLCHAGSVFLSSPFDEAAVLVLDGVAEAWSGAMYHARRFPSLQISCLRKFRFPHSLGLLYSAVTEHLGFQHNREEGKVMAMAAYGDDRFLAEMRNICRLRGNYLFIEQDCFDFGVTWTTEQFSTRFCRRRERSEPLSSSHFSLAYAVQEVVNERCRTLASQFLAETKCRHLCFCGGLALNPVINSRLLHHSCGDKLFVIPTGGDAGTPIGAVLLEEPDSSWSLTSPYIGRGISQAEIESVLTMSSDPVVSHERSRTIDLVARLLDRNSVGGLCQGRAEMGPRALGHRSIIADPRHEQTRERINNIIKKRELFQPLSPAIAPELLPADMVITGANPYMLQTVKLPPNLARLVPAVVHHDGTSRVQAVYEHDDSGLYDIIAAFGQKSGVPIILNTSLNLQHEPLCNSAIDAYRVYKNGGLDFLVLDNHLIVSADQLGVMESE